MRQSLAVELRLNLVFLSLVGWTPSAHAMSILTNMLSMHDQTGLLKIGQSKAHSMHSLGTGKAIHSAADNAAVPASPSAWGLRSWACHRPCGMCRMRFRCSRRAILLCRSSAIWLSVCASSLCSLLATPLMERIAQHLTKSCRHSKFKCVLWLDKPPETQQRSGSPSKAVHSGLNRSNLRSSAC